MNDAILFLPAMTLRPPLGEDGPNAWPGSPRSPATRARWRCSAGSRSTTGSSPSIPTHVGTETYVVTEGYARTVHEWRPKPSKPDNHWFHCLVGCAVAASMAGVTALGEGACGRQRKRYTQDDLRRKDT